MWKKYSMFKYSITVHFCFSLIVMIADCTVNTALCTDANSECVANACACKTGYVVSKADNGGGCVPSKPLDQSNKKTCS